MTNSGENQVGANRVIRVSGSPLRRRLMRLWLSQHAHAIFWVTFGAVLLVTYFYLHLTGSIHDRYQSQVKEKLAIAAKIYQIRLNNETGRYQLYVGDEPYESRSNEVGPLGIGKMITARGILAGVSEIIEDYNRSVEEYVNDFIVDFEPVAGISGSYQRPLKGLLGGDYIPDFGDENIDPVIRITLSDSNELRQIPANERGLNLILRIIDNAEIFNLNKSEYTSNVEENLNIIEQNNTGNEMVNKMTKRVAAGVENFVFPLANENITSKIQKGTKTPIKVVRDFMKSKLEKIRKPMDEIKAIKEIKIIDKDCKNNDCKNEKTKTKGITVSQFQGDLLEFSTDEISFFWIFGYMVWVEVVLLTWLGVLTEGMTRLGASYVGRDDGSIWNPRESLRTFLKFVYAPALTIVVIWTFFFTDLIEFESPLAEGGIVYFVFIAFVLGLFPNLGYSLLKKLAEAVFRETSIAQKPKRKSTVIVREPRTLPIESTKPPSFDEMKERMKRHVVAPLSN